MAIPWKKCKWCGEKVQTVKAGPEDGVPGLYVRRGDYKVVGEDSKTKCEMNPGPYKIHRSR